MTHVINICAPGHLDPYDSYSLVALELARHLSRMGVYVNLFAMGKREMDTQDAEIAAIVRQPIRPAFGAIMLGYPTSFHEHQNPLAHIGPRVALTMWESSKPPQAWLEPLNVCDAIVTPSRFCKKVFENCGVTVPVHAVPLGILDTFEYAARPTDRPLTFLALLDRGARKGGVTALQAFLRAFGDSPDVHLILKSRKPKVEVTLTNPNITMVQRDMTVRELYDLYLRADVMIFATKGEGWGLPCREFSCTGGLALATDWGGTADDIDLWGMPLPYTLERADWAGHKSLQGQDLGEWAAVDSTAVANVLQTIAANRAYYAKMGEIYAARARKLYSWRTTAERVWEIYQEVAVGNPVGAAAA